MYALDEILSDIDWRMGELAILKTIPHRYCILSEHQDILKTYFIPAMYALWEGFVNNSFQIYIRFLNGLKLKSSEMDTSILTFALMSNDRLNLESPRLNFAKQRQCVELFNLTLASPIVIDPKIPTKSNVNFKVINSLLAAFNLQQLSMDYKSPLDKLLMYRNSISHGERSVNVSDKDISDFTDLILALMADVCIKIEEGMMMKTFLKSP